MIFGRRAVRSPVTVKGEGDSSGSMSGKMPKIGGVPCYRSKKYHARWRVGKKKGLRRARRREDRVRAVEE